MDQHEFYMNRALELARQGWGRTNPNPLVGAVIVKDGAVIAEGYHQVCGGFHAEAAALRNARRDVRGGALYVNLEPCSHTGRTPPCAAAIIAAGISRVVLAMEDPNPKVSGRGIRMLREAGIEVVTGVLEPEARRLNEIFISYITRRKSFLIMKTAMTLDGKIASAGGDSRWISGAASREYVHQIRDRVAAIMVGSNTVTADDPALTTRLRSGKGKDPVRIVVDSQGATPMTSRVFNVESPAGVILATTTAIDPTREKQFLDKGVALIKADGTAGRVDLQALMDELYRREIDSVLLEGGGELNAAVLDLGLVDKVIFFIAPKIIGGKGAPTPVAGTGIKRMQDALQLEDIRVGRCGADLLIEGYPKGKTCLQG